MKTYLLTGLIAAAGAIAIITHLVVRFMTAPACKPGTVIIFNGPSAAGKSSIQKNFQQLMMPDLWLKLGIDNLFDSPMPEINTENLNFWTTKNPIRWVSTTHDAQENAIITLHTGPQGEQVAYAMNSAIAAYAKQGCNIIVDYIAYKKAWLDDLRAKLADIPTCWVKINAPLEVLEARETARGTSPRGHARSHHATVHWDLTYDLEFDTGTTTAQKIAAQLTEKIRAQTD